MTLSKDAMGRFLISGIVIVILSLQAVASFVDTGRWGWPLVAYPMYKEAHYDGSRLNHQFVVYAVMADSSRVEVKPADLNMSAFFLFWANVVQAVRHGHLDLLEPVVQRYCEQYDNQIIKLQVEDLGIAIGRDGPVEGLPPQVHFETEVSCL